MDSNEKLKETNIKNLACHYFDDIIKFRDLNLDNLSIDEKSYQKILVITFFTIFLMGAKPLRIMFDKIDGCIRVYDGIRYLLFSGGEKYEFIYTRIRYLTGQKSSITYVTSHNYAKINVDSYSPLSLEKALTFHRVILLIKSVFDKDKSIYYCNIFLEKSSYK